MSEEPNVITLATLPEATAQEVFNQVALHLLRQGEKSETMAGGCRYRARLRDRTLRCAAGCLISDDGYDPEMEGIDWGALVAAHKVPTAHFALISALQKLHDDTEVATWATNLALLADRARLQIPPCVVSMLKLQGAFHEPKI